MPSVSGHLPAMLTPPLPPGTQGRRPEPIRPGPLAGRYAPAAAMVILFLVPFLGLSSARPPLTLITTAQLHMSPQTLGLALGLANAGYAVGTVLAVHHCWEHAAALAEVAAAIQDETQPLGRAGVIRPGGRRYAGAPRSLGQWC